MQKGIQYTTILHQPRIKAGLTCNEYVIASTIFNMQNNDVMPGWCYATKDWFAELVGLSRRSVITLIFRLVDLGFVEKSDSGKLLKTTKKWRDEIEEFVLDEENSPKNTVKKVHSNTVKKVHSASEESSLEHSEESSLGGVKKVHPIIILDSNSVDNDIHKCNTPPDGGDASPKKDNHFLETQVTEVLEMLNAYSGRKLPTTGDRANGSRTKVKNLYKRKYSQTEIKEVIQCKCFEWKNDQNMVQYLHPATLFLPSNFQKYLDLVNDLKNNPDKAQLFKNKVNKVKNGNSKISDEFKQTLARILD